MNLLWSMDQCDKMGKNTHFHPWTCVVTALISGSYWNLVWTSDSLFTTANNAGWKKKIGVCFSQAQLPFLESLSWRSWREGFCYLAESVNRYLNILSNIETLWSVILRNSGNDLHVQGLKTYMIVAQIITMSWKWIVVIMGYKQNIS